MMLSRVKSFIEGHASRKLCPECDAEITSDDINIREGVALCPACGALPRLSDLNHSGRTTAEVFANPPSGCSITRWGQGVTIRVSLRSVTSFLGATAVALFWNGITSVFVMVAIAGLYSNLIGPVPEWFPAGELVDGKPKMNDKPMNLGMTLFLCLFLVPFVAIGVGMIGAAISSLFGKVVVRLEGPASYAGSGVGPLVWKSRFDADQVSGVGYVDAKWKSEGSEQREIEITADRSVKFGSLMSRDKQDWIRAVLKELLFKPRQEWRCRID